MLDYLVCIQLSAHWSIVRYHRIHLEKSESGKESKDNSSFVVCADDTNFLQRNSEQRVLVCGGNSPLGRQLIRCLIHKNVNVRAGVRSERAEAELRSLGAEVVFLNHNSPSTVRTAMKNIDKLFLMTGFSEKMVKQTQTLLEEAKLANVTHVVKISTLCGGLTDKYCSPIDLLHR